MKKYAFIFLTFCLFLFSCNKDQDTNPVLLEKGSSSTDTYLAFGDYECPEAENFTCDDIDFTIEEMLGDVDLGLGSSGKLDRILNCISPVSNCQRVCPSKTTILQVRDFDGYDFIWRDGEEPCGGDNLFSAQEQEDFLEAVEFHVNEFAPMCGNRKMTALRYDLFADFLTSNSSTNFYIFVEVTYISHCQRTRFRF